jgi:HD-GYP domain-containing protein (c-di-GMP phosphodiesterase class II)
MGNKATDHSETIAKHQEIIAKQKETIAKHKKIIAKHEETIANREHNLAISQKRFVETADVLDATLLLLSKTIELKDPYTSGHSSRVADIAVRFVKANETNLDKSHLSCLRYAAFIHDIGKLGISEAILNKPTLLTEAERIMIQYHPNLGKNLLRHLGLDENITLAILHHHEDYDGGGYPDGLKGEAIPLIARILRLADFYDAVTSDRPYRKAYSHKQALKIMRENENCFDPDLLPMFLDFMA